MLAKNVFYFGKTFCNIKEYFVISKNDRNILKALKTQ